MHASVIISRFLPSSDVHARSRAIGWITLVCTIIVGSTSTTFTKQLSDGLSPLSILFLSESIVLLFTILSFGFFPLLEELSSVQKKFRMPIFIVACLNSIIAPLLVFSGIHLAGAINSELYLRSNGLFLFVFASLFLREETKRTDLFAMICIFLGLLIVAMKGFSNGIIPSTGDMLVLAGAITYAMGSMIFKSKLNTVDPEVIIFCRSLTAIMFFFLVSPFLDVTLIEELRIFPVILLSALFGYGFLSRFVYLFSFYETISRLPVHTVSMALPLMSIGSIIFTHIQLQEPIEWYHVIGGFCIIFGSIVMRLSWSHFRGLHLERHLYHGMKQHV